MIKLGAELLQQKPMLGAWAGFGGGLSGLLAALKVISVLFGAFGAILGCVAAGYTIYNQIQVKRDRDKTASK